MDVIPAYREVGSYRGAAQMCATRPKTVKRVIARHKGPDPGRAPRARNYGSVTDLVAEQVKKTQGRISAKRLLPEARADGYEGSARSVRRLVAEQKVLWRQDRSAPGGVVTR